MTRLLSAEPCMHCGGALVPPEATPRDLWTQVPLGCDYVCVACGRVYVWDDREPRLVWLTTLGLPTPPLAA